MSQRRMTSLEVIDTDAFLDMPVSSQLLYFHLNMRADDDGFVANPKKIVRMLNAGTDDLKVLIGKKFIMAFEDGVCVIKHWRINNFIRKDIYKETKYLDLKRTLFIRKNGAYTQTQDERSTLVPQGHFRVDDLSTSRQPRLGKVRVGKDRLSCNQKLQEKQEEIFNQDDTLLGILNNDKNRHIRLIARFLMERRKRYGTPDFTSKEQINATFPRYVRVAKKVAAFENNQIIEMFEKAFERVGDETTLETVYKYLTK